MQRDTGILLDLLPTFRNSEIISKRLPGLSNLPYTKRLEVLGKDSLGIRRLRFDLVFVYKMLFGLVDLKFSDYFVLRTIAVSYTHLTLPTNREV